MFAVEYIISACVQLSEEGHKVLFPVLQIQIKEHKYKKSLNPASPFGGLFSRAPDYRIGVLHSRLVWCLICRLCLSLFLSLFLSFSLSLSISLSLHFSSPWSHTFVPHMMPQNMQTGTSLNLCLVILVDYYCMFSGLSNIQYGSYDT